LTHQQEVANEYRKPDWHLVIIINEITILLETPQKNLSFFKKIKKKHMFKQNG